MTLQQDFVVNGCKLLKYCGNGRFGAVWKAHDETLQCTVALKLYLPRLSDSKGEVLVNDSAMEDMARKEARLRTQLAKEVDIPIVYRFEPYSSSRAPDEYRWTLVMDYIPGPNLEQHLGTLRERYGCDSHILYGYLKDRRLASAGAKIKYEKYVHEALPRLINTFVRIVKTTLAMHSHKEIHRDIKPLNILLHEELDERPYLVDLGVGANLDAEGMATNAVRTGSRPYVAPEQYWPHKNERADGRSDVFSLGATLYHILTLFPPYVRATSNGQLECSRNGRDLEPERLETINTFVDPHLAGIVERAMAIDRDHRQNSVKEFLDELVGWQLVQRTNRESTGKPRPEEVFRTLSTLLQKRSAKSRHPADLIPYDIVDKTKIKDALKAQEHLRWLVQYGVLHMEPTGYRLPNLAKGGAPEFTHRNEEEWMEKFAIGHITSLLIADSEVVAVDAGTTTLAVLRAIIYRDLDRNLNLKVPTEIYTNNLMGLAETVDIDLRSEWFTFEGQRIGRTNAIMVKRPFDNWRPSAAVIGINALSRHGKLATTTGSERPIKELLIQRARKDVYVILNPAKLGEEGTQELAAEVNLEALINDDERRITIVTAQPYCDWNHKINNHSERTIKFFSNLTSLVRWWPKPGPEIHLYAVPSSPGKMMNLRSLGDAESSTGDASANVREQFMEFWHKSESDSVICVSLRSRTPKREN